MSEAIRLRGRPRDPALDAAILRTAFEIVAERGFAAMSIEAVAERAGVGKAAIYRRWPGRVELALDAFFAGTEEELRFPEAPSGALAFRTQLLALGDLLRGPVGDAFAAMLAGARQDARIGRAMAERWVGPRRAWGVLRLERAIADGQCVAGLDVDAALTALYSPLYAPLLLGRGIDPPERIEAWLGIVMRGIFKDPL